uniref:Uncharacterized protein n=1 Tax=Arundo donax TaxID=35708 RepID=A0A0A8ZM85_ARUDO
MSLLTMMRHYSVFNLKLSFFYALAKPRCKIMLAKIYHLNY